MLQETFLELQKKYHLYSFLKQGLIQPEGLTSYILIKYLLSIFRYSK